MVAAWVCLVAAVLLVGSWTLRPVLLAWTALVPDLDPAWHVARETCRQRAKQSVTTVLPFALALSLLGVLVGAGSVLSGGTGMEEMAILLGWALLVAWVGGIAVIALAGRQRTRDTVVVAVAGAEKGVLTRLVLLEGCAYAVTAIVVGLLFLVGSVATTAVASQVPVGTAFAGYPWGLFAAAAAATIATTCLTVYVSARRSTRSPSLELLGT